MSWVLHLEVDPRLRCKDRIDKLIQSQIVHDMSKTQDNKIIMLDMTDN